MGRQRMIFNEDCFETMKRLQRNSVDLVITSPPYAEQRKNTYGGIPEKKYTQWFSDKAQQIFRIRRVK